MKECKNQSVGKVDRTLACEQALPAKKNEEKVHFFSSGEPARRLIGLQLQERVVMLIWSK